MFGSIFNTYHGAPILCCTTTDFGIFGVAFVRALNTSYNNGSAQ